MPIAVLRRRRLRRPSMLVLTVAAVALASLQAPATPSSAASPRDSRAALVIVDVQAFYFPGGKLPLVEPEAAAARAGRALAEFRRRGWPVAHVQHLPDGVDRPDPKIADEQYRIHPEVLPTAGEKLVGKHHVSSFRGTDLEAWLRAEGVQQLVVVGMQTHMCVEALVRAAADLGFTVTVLHDACATRPLRHGDIEVPAAMVHAATLATLRGSYAEVMSVDEWLTVMAAADESPGAPEAPQGN